MHRYRERAKGFFDDGSSKGPQHLYYWCIYLFLKSFRRSSSLFLTIKLQMKTAYSSGSEKEEKKNFFQSPRTIHFCVDTYYESKKKKRGTCAHSQIFL